MCGLKASMINDVPFIVVTKRLLRTKVTKIDTSQRLLEKLQL